MDMLQSMNHRWPGISDYATMIKDHIIIVRDSDTRSAAFQFSQTSLPSVEIVDLETSNARRSCTCSLRVPVVTNQQ